MDSIAYITSRKKQYDLKDLESRRTKLDIKDLPKNVSAFFNDEGYVDKTVSDLINYYKKSETYTKEEIQNLVSTRILIKIVDKLPESNISTSTIYFLKRPQEDLPQSQYQSDVYDEYIYVDATWELIGNTYVDLTPYYTKEEVEIVINNKILEERLIRENAEYVLQTNINSLEKKINSEITQIKQKNLNQDNSISTLETNLQNEITRATNRENELSDRYDSYDSHVENKNNPHNVTKTQIGLSNVENLPIDDTPTLNSENYVKSGGVFNALENKVDKEDGKGLSDENFTYAEKTKLSNLKNYNDAEIQNKVNKNTSAISILNSDSTVDGSVDNKIKNALLDVSGLQFNVVEKLPTTGENGIIYFVLNTSINEGKNYYDEYIWINNKFELLGQTVTEIDLSNYHTKAEISALLSSKASTTQLSTAEANAKNLANATGTLAISKGGTGATTAKTAQNNLLTMSESTNAVSDNDLIVQKYTTPTEITGTLLFKKASAIWTYIKGKISSVLGLTSTSYGGNSATATKATQDSAGQQINTTYIKGLSISGKTITYTKGDNTTGTLTTQDTNTTYICGNTNTVATKEITVEGFTLKIGACIKVVFTNGNNVTKPTLNVSNTGAKEIVAVNTHTGNIKYLSSKFGDSVVSGAYIWSPNTILEMYYNGSYWVIMNNPLVYKEWSSRGTHSYYIKIHADGWKEMQGWNTASTKGTYTLLLPISFGDNDYFAIVSAYDTEGRSVLHIETKTTTTMIINRVGYECTNWGWEAKGY